jgi:hypothetical protein
MMFAMGTMVIGCGDCGDEGANNTSNSANGVSNGAANGTPNSANGATNSASNSASGSNRLAMTVPPNPSRFGPLTLAAGVPVQVPFSFTLPSDVNVGSVVDFAVNAQATADAITIVRTDGGNSPDPTLNIRFAVVEGGDTTAACDTAAPVVDLTVTGTSPDFSQKTAEDSGQGSAALDGPLAIGGEFSTCFELESSVNVEATLAIAVEVELDAPCVDEPPRDIAGTWAGPYMCTSTCGGPGEADQVELTVLQAGETAIYFDTGPAFYLGSVCGGEFSFVGGGVGYSEWGVFTRTSETTATKTSKYEDTTGDCGGDCSDELTLQ